MSLASFPRPEVVYEMDTTCEPAKMVLTFRGPPSAPLGHSIDPPPQPPKHRHNRRNKKYIITEKYIDPEEYERIREKKLKKMESFSKFKKEFRDKGIKTALHATIEQKVQCACSSTDHILVQKRSRLRELLLAEEVAYATEYVAMCQQANANREEDLRRHAFEVQSKAERERQQFAKEKILEQKMASYEPARTMYTRIQMKELKQDQLWQMKQKCAMQEAKKEEDRMYHDLMIKNILAMKENEEEIAKLNWKKQKETQKAFVQQMKWKEEKEEQERRLKEFERAQIEEEVRKAKEEDAKEKAERQQKKEKVQLEIREHLEQDRIRRERRKREEEEIEQTFNELLRIEAAKELKKEKSNKERLKREMDIFLEKTRELKRLQLEEEKKCDVIIQELREKKREQKDAERRRLREAREELFKDVLRGREGQLREKRERERQEAEREKAEIELLQLQLQQQDKIREEYERRCAEQRKEYHRQLREQIEIVREERRVKREEEKELVRQILEKEERDYEEMKVLVSRFPVIHKEHPMKTIMRENPPKYPCIRPYMSRGEGSNQGLPGGSTSESIR